MEVRKEETVNNYVIQITSTYTMAANNEAEALAAVDKPETKPAKRTIIIAPGAVSSPPAP
jgi:hypothetical protein